MICVTTHTIERNEIQSSRGIVAAEIIQGVNWISDLANELRDSWGGRGLEYERHFKEGREKAIAVMQEQALAKGANPIVAVKFAYQILGEANGMLMVAATGTAVVVEKNEREKERDAQHAREDVAEHYVNLGNGEKGQFSITQLRALLAAEKIGITDVVRTDGSPGASTYGSFPFLIRHPAACPT